MPTKKKAAKKAKGKKGKGGGDFGKRFQGAIDAGYPKSEAAAIANAKESREQKFAAAVRGATGLGRGKFH